MNISESDSNSRDSKIFELDPDLTIHWELQFGRPFFSQGLVARFQLDKPKEPWLKREMEDDKKRNTPLGKRLLYLIELLIAIIIVGSISALLPFTIIWIVASIFSHAQIITVITALLSIHFAGMTVYLAVSQYIHRDPTARRHLNLGFRVFGYLALAFSMYTLAAPLTSQFEVFGSKSVNSLWLWLVYYGYMFINVIGLGSPQAIFGEIAALKPASLFAGIGTFWVNVLMAVTVFELIKILGSYYFMRRKMIICTTNELKTFLSKPDNRKRYKNALIVAKNVELETVYSQVETQVSKLDFNKSWQLLSNGSIISINNKSVDNSQKSKPDSSKDDLLNSNLEELKKGWSFFFSIGVLVISFIILSLIIQSAINMNSDIMFIPILIYSLYFTLGAIIYRGSIRLRNQK